MNTFNDFLEFLILSKASSKDKTLFFAMGWSFLLLLSWFIYSIADNKWHNFPKYRRLIIFCVLQKSLFRRYSRLNLPHYQKVTFKLFQIQSSHWELLKMFPYNRCLQNIVYLSTVVLQILIAFFFFKCKLQIDTFQSPWQ